MILSKKTFILLFSATILFASCKKDETSTVANEVFVLMESDSMTLSGTFVSSDHPTNGSVEVFDNGTEQTISFKNFKGDNGPDLRVYLSSDLGDGDIIDMGKLTAVSGDYSYKTASSTDLTKYKNVLIWCEDFSVLFGHAVLK
ncbi:MAG: hypothetical protein ACI80H_000489 [Pseudoalteromonas distincta]|jgi:hypothetical protein